MIDIPRLNGYTKEVWGYAPQASDETVQVHLLVKPESDLADDFRAWHWDSGQWVRVRGEAYYWEAVEGIGDSPY